jgi:hypothetical protein
MSKITDYQEQLRQRIADDDRQSVADFAAELKKSTESLLAQLKDAGVPKASALDNLTQADKQALLTHLQKSHGTQIPRKKITITIESQEQKLIRSVDMQENGAEFEALRHFAGSVVWGEAIDPTFQKLVNLITAKAVIAGVLPLERLGRPKREELESIGHRAAQRYWEMIDSGVSYQEAVEILSREFYKSERHMMRLISKHKKDIGETVEERSRKRQRDQIVREMYNRPGAMDHMKSMLSMFEPKVPLPELSLDDYLDHLEELTQQLAASIKPLTKKI